MSDAICALWIEGLEAAYMLARGERLNELRGTKQRFLDARGIHPFSEAWGLVEAAQHLCPDLGADGVATSPHALWRAARADADDEFREEIVGQMTLEVAA